MTNCTHNLTSRVLCLAILFSALVVVSPGKAIAWPGGGGVDMVDEAVRDMQWRQKVERPKTPAPRQAIPAPTQGPAVPQPDLSGLPRQLPQMVPDTPPPVDAAKDRTLTKPRLEDSRLEKQTLIKPRLKGAAAHEPAPGTREKAPKPVRGAVQVQPGSSELATTFAKPIDAHRPGTLSKPKLDSSRQGKPALIKPRLGKVPAQERTPAVSQRVKKEPTREAVRVQPKPPAPQPSRKPIKEGPSSMTRPAPVQAQQQAAAPIIQPIGSPAQTPGTVQATAGLIKPRLGGLAPEETPLVRKPPVQPPRRQPAMAQPQAAAAPYPQRYPSPQQQVDQSSPMPQPMLPPQVAPPTPQPYPQVSYAPQQQHPQPQPQMAPPMPPQPPQRQPLLRPQMSEDRYSTADAEQSRRMWRMMGSWE